VTAPLTLAEFAGALERLGPFEDRPMLAAAVSGGPDSLALAILAERWARAHNGTFHALSVDHRLRPESGTELEELGGWLAARDIRHEILVWSGAKPTNGIQEAARDARYRLLAERCRELGFLHLLTAHHRDDQAETHVIRRRAGSGAVGLAGMSAIRELASCRVLRPLLGFNKKRLIALLAAEDQPFLVDPSNRNPAFERSRIRDDLPDGVDLEPLPAEIRRLGIARQAHERAVDALLARAVTLHPAGFATVDPDHLAAAPDAVAETALAALAATIGVTAYQPRRARVARLRAALAVAPRRGATLGGCHFVPWRGHILVLREIAHAAPPAALAPGQSGVWDRRFVASLPEAAPRCVMIGHLGRAGIAELNRLAPQLRGGTLPAVVRPHLPAAWDESGLLCVPDLGYRRAPATALPRFRFNPLRPLTSAGFTVV